MIVNLGMFPTEAPVTGRITCRVCLLPFQGTPDRPSPLCDHCVADLPATKAHIRALWDAAERAYVEAQAALTALENAADAATRVRCAAVDEALLACHGLPGPTLSKRLDAAEARGDALSPIVAAIRAMDRAVWHYSEVEAWEDEGQCGHSGVGG